MCIRFLRGEMHENADLRQYLTEKARIQPKKEKTATCDKTGYRFCILYDKINSFFPHPSADPSRCGRATAPIFAPNGSGDPFVWKARWQG